MKCFICSKIDCTDYHSLEEIYAARDRQPTAEELREALRALVACAKKLEEQDND